ncbi:MAG: BrxA/BrxB family bacilliredoxin [Bacteroidota bacterium]
MPYPEPLVQPMREELTRLGVRELTDTAAVDAALDEAAEGTTLVVINSVCGCAAANARPAVAMAANAPNQPDRMVTVFAGQDLDATARVREYLAGIPPSSPFMALLKDGDPVYLIERRHIEGRTAGAIATDLVNAYAKYCGTEATADDGPETPAMPDYAAQSRGLPPTFRSIR